MNNNIRKILKDEASQYKFELDMDAVGRWQIVHKKDMFDLSDNDVQEHIYDSVSNDCGNLSLRGVSFAKELSSDIQNWVQKNSISEKDLSKHP